MPGPSNIVVRWRTLELTDSYVLCGTNIENLSLAFQNPGLTTEHEVGLSNLQAQTTYYYAVGAENTAVLSGEDMHFTTAPPIGTNVPVRIWFISDYGFYEIGELAVRDSYFNYVANSRPADVWLTGGDNAQHDGTDGDYQIAVFDTYSQLLRTTPIWPALGNHDVIAWSDPGPHPLYDIFTLPTNGEAGGVASGSESYFSFDYGNVHFISLDSVDQAFSESTNTAMLQWLQRDLAQTRQPWKIAWWHAPPYTKGGHDSDNPIDLSGWMIQMRENAVPILESFGVDLVLCGHSHIYERSYLLNGHYGYSQDFNETNKVDGGDGREDGDGAYHKSGNRGAVYVVAAEGSSPTTLIWAEQLGEHPANYIMLNQLGSCMVDITDRRLDFQFFGADTNVLDYFTIIKDPPVPAPRITAVSYAEYKISLTWDSVVGQVYQVYRRSSLGDTPILLADEIQADTESTSWSGNLDPADRTGFFSVAARSN
jgi:hypothetical protein